MKNLLFTLITLTLSSPLYGMMQPLGTDYQALFEEAIVHAGNNQNDRVATCLKWIATHDTDTYRVAACHYGLGNINAQNRKYKKAKTYLKRARDQHENLPAREQALVDLGLLYSRQNKYRKAECHYKQAFKESDDAVIQADALNHLAQEQQFTRIAHILLTLKQGSFDDHSGDDATEPSQKKNKSEGVGELVESQSTRLARESLLRKIGRNEEDI